MDKITVRIETTEDGEVIRSTTFKYQATVTWMDILADFITSGLPSIGYIIDPRKTEGGIEELKESLTYKDGE